MLLITPDERAVFAWRLFISGDGQQGVNNCIFRNEAPDLYRSSDLIRDAMELAWSRWFSDRWWPDVRFYTYVNPRKVRSSNPGYCYQRAGWRRCGTTKRRGLLIFEWRACLTRLGFWTDDGQVCDGLVRKFFVAKDEQGGAEIRVSVWEQGANGKAEEGLF